MLYGINGVLGGVVIFFFVYIGFDIVVSIVEEVYYFVKNVFLFFFVLGVRMY